MGRALDSDTIIATVVLIAAAVVGFFVLGVAANAAGGLISVALLWGLGCVVGGAFLGFLFGIPRVSGDAPPEGDGEDATAAPYRQLVNANLVEISDWLTKIIVGVGLIQLHRMPALVVTVSAFVGRGMTGAPAEAPPSSPPAPAVGATRAATDSLATLADSAGTAADTAAAGTLGADAPDLDLFARADGPTVVALGALVYFGILGFLGGYILTRLHLAGAFGRADRSAIVGGFRLPLASAVDQLRRYVYDLADQVSVGLARDSAAEGAAFDEVVSARAEATPLSPVLWVDDHPEHNSTEREYLASRGVTVDLATATTDALAKLGETRYAAVLTDLSRREGLREKADAGLDLLRQMRERGHDQPVVVYTTMEKAAALQNRLADDAQASATASPFDLYRVLGLSGRPAE